MAHPGYPHGPNPYPPAPPAAPPRRGTSKAVPIVFSIALAGGTFAGLTLALGTGKKDDAAETKKKEPVAVVTPDAGATVPPDAAPPTGTTVTALTPDAAPAPAKATLTIEVTPPDVKTKITVDGQEVTGPVEITLDKTGTKTVKVVAKASGYRTYEEKVTVEGNETLAIKLRKRSSSGHGDSSGSGKGSNENVIDL